MFDLERTKKILLDHGYEYVDVLGQGSFSSIYLCQRALYNQQFAIKKAIKNEMSDYEYKLMVRLNHQHIIRLYDVFEDDTSQYLVLEYCSSGTIQQKGKLSKDQFVFFARQILEALAYCHSINIAHRDIKPENIFLDQNNHIKLGDFGMAKTFGCDEKSKEKCGSLMFFSPEMIGYQSVCPFKADIWALGITFFYMITGNFPFQSQSREQLKQLIFLGEIEYDKYDIDPDIKYLINRMTAKNINLRPTASEILQFPMFASGTIKKHLILNERHSTIRFTSLQRTQTNLLANEIKNKHFSDDFSIPISLKSTNTYKIIKRNPKYFKSGHLLLPKTF